MNMMNMRQMLRHIVDDATRARRFIDEIDDEIRRCERQRRRGRQSAREEMRAGGARQSGRHECERSQKSGSIMAQADGAIVDDD